MIFNLTLYKLLLYDISINLKKQFWKRIFSIMLIRKYYYNIIIVKINIKLYYINILNKTIKWKENMYRKKDIYIKLNIFIKTR